MITRDIAAQVRGKLYHFKQRDGRGGPRAIEVCGKPTLFTDRPDDFILPVRHLERGKNQFVITPSNAAEWLTPEQWAEQSIDVDRFMR